MVFQRTLVACVGVLAACSCGGGTPRSDAGDDADAADVDVGDVGGDDAGPRDAGFSFAVTPQLDVLSGDPCPDWTGVSPTPRRLPADVTARQLWRYFAYDDPLYQSTGLSNQWIGYRIAVGPEGSVYTTGPDRERVQRIGPDGRLRWMSQRLGEIEAERVAVAPDGSAFATVRTPTGPGLPSELSLVRLAAESGAFAARRLGLVSPDASALPLAIGPEGRLYVAITQSGVEATCGASDSAPRWRLTFADEAGRPVTTRDLTVLANGDLWITLENLRSARVRPDGSVTAWFPSEPPNAALSQVRVIQESELLLSYYQLAPEEQWWTEVWRDEAPAMSVGPVAQGGLLCVASPRRSYWCRQYGPHRELVQRPAETVRASMAAVAGSDFTFAADGSRFGVSASNRGQVVREDESGEIAWSFTPSGIDGLGGLGLGSDTIRRGILLHQNGVVYVRAGQGGNNYVIAIQTDQLPPTEVGCWDMDCNPRRSNWLGGP